MHIYIIGRHLNPPGPREDRLIKIGRQWVKQEHRVTVFLPAEGMNFNLSGKKIGLTEEEGLVLVAFNAPDMGLKDLWNKGNKEFACLINQQGRMLPAPDLILVVAPPLSTAIAGEELSRELKVPLVLEMREGFDEEEAKRGFISGLFARSRARKEENLLASAKSITAEGKAVAARIAGQLTEQEKNKVKVIEGRESEEELKAFYDCLLPEGKNK